MRRFVMTVGALVALGFVQVVQADSLGTYGDASAVAGGYQLTSDNSSSTPYAGLYDTPSGVLTPTTLTDLSADYQMTIGTFGAGSQRSALCRAFVSCKFLPDDEALIEGINGDRIFRTQFVD